MRRDLDGGFELDDDPSRMDLAEVHRFLAEESYWARERTLEEHRRYVHAAARVVGLYRGAAQVGFARVISDGASLAYLADVYVRPEHGGRGLGTELVRETIDGGPLADLHWLLQTRDAHSFYERLGFGAPVHPALERRARRRG